MSPKGPFSFKKSIRSFAHAIQGLKEAWKSEHNFRIHLFLLVVALSLGIYLKLSLSEWGLFVFASGLVLVSELFNTTIEWVCDYISPAQDPKIKRIKDVAAAAVIISAICAVTIALIIFLPHLF